MVPFIVEGLSGIPLDPRTARGASARRSEEPREKQLHDLVSFEGGRLLREIEVQKESLLGKPFLRDEQVESARADIEAGLLDQEDAIEDAADRMLRGESSENPSIEGL